MIENLKQKVEVTHLSADLIEQLELAPEEVEEYEDAMALVESIESISESEMTKVMDKYYKEIPDDCTFEEGLQKFMELGKKDPEFIKKVLLMFEILNEVDSPEEEPAPVIEKISVNELNQAADLAKKEEFDNKMKKVYEFINSKKG